MNKIQFETVKSRIEFFFFFFKGKCKDFINNTQRVTKVQITDNMD